MEAFLWALVGLLMGAFLNLCADELPRYRKLTHHLPRCPYCGRERKVMSAVAAYLLGRGHCAGCGAPIPLRWPVVELSCMLASAFLWKYHGSTIAFVLTLFYTGVFILVFVIDLEHRLIPDVLILPAIALALAGSLVANALGEPAPGGEVSSALLGGVTGLVLMHLAYLLGTLFAALMGRWRGQPLKEVAFGFGDVKLSLFIGLVTGFPAVLLALAIGVALGGLFAALYLVVKALQGRYSAFTPIPYGPFLVIGGMATMLYGRQILAWLFH